MLQANKPHLSILIMKKAKILFSVAALAFIFSSCSVTMPLAVSAAPIGSKVGVSKTGVLFGNQMNKSFGIGEAAHNGKITGGVGVADLKIKSSPFAFIFYKKEIIVYGN